MEEFFKEIKNQLISKGYDIECARYDQRFIVRKNNILINVSSTKSEKQLNLNIYVDNSPIFKGSIKSIGEFEVLEKQLNLSKKENFGQSLLIREFTEETSVYIYGGWIRGINANISLTDDEQGIDIYVGQELKNRKAINTGGALYILTPEELKKNANSIEESGCGEYIYIESFKCKITVDLPPDSDCKFKENINLETDDLCHSFVSYDDDEGNEEEDEYCYICPNIILHPSTDYCYPCDPQPTSAIEQLFMGK